MGDIVGDMERVAAEKGKHYIYMRGYRLLVFSYEHYRAYTRGECLYLYCWEDTLFGKRTWINRKEMVDLIRRLINNA